MTLKPRTTIALFGIVCIALSVGIVLRGLGVPDSGVGDQVRDRLPPQAPDALTALEVDGSAEREREPQEAVSEEELPAQAPVVVAVRGKVVNTEDEPVETAHVYFIPVGLNSLAIPPGSSSIAQTGQDGRFEFTAPMELGWIVAKNDAWATVLPYYFEDSAGQESPIRIVVGPRVVYAGTVMDARGQAVEDAEVRMEVDERYHRGLRETAPASIAGAHAAASDELGRFSLTDIAWTPSCRVSAYKNGYLHWEVEVSPFHDLDMRVVLQEAGLLVAGRVVDEHGAGLAGAHVVLGIASCLTEEDGSFLLEFQEGAAAGPLRAAKTGYAPVETTEVEPRSSIQQALASATIIRLGARAKSISGRVERSDGAPVPGAIVWTSTTTEFGVLGSALPEGVVAYSSVSAEALAGGRAPEVVADELGAFVLTGLVAEHYALHAADPVSMEIGSVEKAMAGDQDVVIAVAEGGLRDVVSGHIVSLIGEPLGGVTVQVSRIATGPAFFSQVPVQYARRQVTGEDGRFAFEGLVAQNARLMVYGEPVVGVVKVDLGSVGDLRDLTIEIAPKCYFRVVGLDVDFADGLYLLNRDGQRANLVVKRGRSSVVGPYVSLSGGQTDVLTATQAAEIIVFVKSGREVGRKNLDLQPDGKVQLVDW